MTCESALELLHEYLDGELPALLATRIRAHLTSCPGCPKKLELEMAFRQVIRRQRKRQCVPRGLRDRILAALCQDAGSGGFTHLEVGARTWHLLVPCALTVLGLS